MFVDRVKIFAQAGDGGNGCVSFRREKFVPRGGPDGGDGGQGGDIVLVADPHTDNLSAQHFQPIIRSGRGQHGMGKQKYGRKGVTTEVKVPVGTMVWHLPEHQPHDRSSSVGAEEADWIEDETQPLPEGLQQPGLGSQAAWNEASLELAVDLTEPGQKYVLCHGGGGGKGNMHFKSAGNRVPRQSTPGEEGQRGHFLLELRVIADVGLVGFPNAGKSSLLTVLTAAHPKVGAYPFTTLRPSVGMVTGADWRALSIADIPGLIEGAHDNVGLGHDFLRHIVRCPILLFVIDIAGSEGREPEADYATLRRELDLYDPRLKLRPFLVAANKMDLPGAEEKKQRFQARYPDAGVVGVSAFDGQGLEALQEELWKMVTELRAIQLPLPENEPQPSDE
ncbi:MAG: GTPase ObgE [Verrucomicrobiales bacterium]